MQCQRLQLPGLFTDPTKVVNYSAREILDIDTVVEVMKLVLVALAVVLIVLAVELGGRAGCSHE